MVKDMVNLEHNKTSGWLGVKMYLEECWEVRMKKWAGKSFVCHLLKFGLYSGAHKDPVYFFVCLFCDVLKRGVTWSVGLNELELFRVLWITCSLVKLSSIKWEKSWLLYILGSWDTMSLVSQLSLCYISRIEEDKPLESETTCLFRTPLSFTYF